MTATLTYNYLWPQGEDLDLTFVYKQGPSGSEIPVDLTGYDVRMDMVNPADQSIVYTFNTAALTDPDEITVDSSGKVTISVPRALTLPPSGDVYLLMVSGTTVYNYDIFLRNPAGKQRKLFRGTITIEPSYTLWA